MIMIMIIIIVIIREVKLVGAYLTWGSHDDHHDHDHDYDDHHRYHQRGEIGGSLSHLGVT